MTEGDDRVDAGPDDAVPDDAVPATRHRHSRTPAIVLAVVVAVAAVAGIGWFVRAWTQRGAEEVSVDKARERSAAGSTQVKALLQPATGVFTYRATGTETLSLLGTSQQWGDTLPLTVTALADGCWQTRIDYSTNHRHTQDFCPAGRELHEVGGRVFQSFDFVAAKVDDETVFTCDPPVVTLQLDAEPGDTWPTKCEGTSPARGTHVTSAGTNTFVGRETLAIGGRPTKALRYRLARTLSGDQKGTDADEYWYDAETGLLLKGTKDVAVASPSPVGDIDYTEKGTFELTSLTPAG